MDRESSGDCIRWNDQASIAIQTDSDWQCLDKNLHLDKIVAGSFTGGKEHRRAAPRPLSADLAGRGVMDRESSGDCISWNDQASIAIQTDSNWQCLDKNLHLDKIVAGSFTGGKEHRRAAPRPHSADLAGRGVMDRESSGDCISWNNQASISCLDKNLRLDKIVAGSFTGGEDN
jgi:hypothetical protein